MIQYHDRLGLLQKFLALRHLRAVRVYYHHHGILVGKINGLGRVKEQIVRIGRIPLKTFIQRAQGRGHLIDDDVSLLLQSRRRAVDSDGCPQRVHIRKLMAHHEYLILDRYELPQGFRLYPGLHAGILGSLLSLSSIIGNAFSILNDCLVSASCQRQIDRHAGIVITLGIGVATKAKADAKRRWNSISDIDGLHVLKQGELILLQLLKILLLKDDEVLIILHLLNDAVHLGDILVNLPIHQSHQKGLSHLFHAAHDLIIVIDIDQARNQPLLFRLLDIPVQFRYIP